MTPDEEIPHSLLWPLCILWAATEPTLVKAFRDETGYDLTATGKGSLLDRMIDKATGLADVTREQFLAWVSSRLYGLEFTPPKFRERFEQMQREGLLPWYAAPSAGVGGKGGRG